MPRQNIKNNEKPTDERGRNDISTFECSSAGRFTGIYRTTQNRFYRTKSRRYPKRSTSAFAYYYVHYAYVYNIIVNVSRETPLCNTQVVLVYIRFDDDGRANVSGFSTPACCGNNLTVLQYRNACTTGTAFPNPCILSHYHLSSSP